jgi:hypothetical protein
MSRDTPARQRDRQFSADIISIISIIDHSDTDVQDYPDEEACVGVDHDADVFDHRWRPVAAIASVVLVLAVIATALILYGGDSASTTATVGPPPTRHVIATPPPSIPTAAPPTSLPRETVTTVTPSAAPTTPSPIPTVEPSPPSEASPPAVNPRTVVYSVSGTKQQLFDLVTVIYTDAQGMPQTDFNVSLPWSKTIVLNPGVQTKSVIATSLAGQLNCAITDAAGQTIVASTNHTIIATCTR